jgi:hypothetical protein
MPALKPIQFKGVALMLAKGGCFFCSVFKRFQSTCGRGADLGEQVCVA